MSGSIDPDSGHFLLDLPFFFGVEPDIGLIRLDPLFSPKVKQDFRPLRLDPFFFLYTSAGQARLFSASWQARPPGVPKTPGEPR